RFFVPTHYFLHGRGPIDQSFGRRSTFILGDDTCTLRIQHRFAERIALTREWRVLRECIDTHPSFGKRYFFFFTKNHLIENIHFYYQYGGPLRTINAAS